MVFGASSSPRRLTSGSSTFKEFNLLEPRPFKDFNNLDSEGPVVEGILSNYNKGLSKAGKNGGLREICIYSMIFLYIYI